MAYALVKGNDSGLIKSDSSETPHSVRTTAGPGLLRPFHLKLGKDCGHLVLPGAFGCGFSDLSDVLVNSITKKNAVIFREAADEIPTLLDQYLDLHHCALACATLICLCHRLEAKAVVCDMSPLRVLSPTPLQLHQENLRRFDRFFRLMLLQVPKQWAQDVAKACEAKEAAHIRGNMQGKP